VVGVEVVGQVVTCGWWLGDGGWLFLLGGWWVKGGTQAVVVVVGRRVCLLDRDKSKKKAKNSPFFSCFCIRCGGCRSSGPGRQLHVWGVVG
jgi:hypothetical protein